MSSIAGIPVDESVVTVAPLAIRLKRVRDLQPFVDAASQLGLGDAPEPPYWMHLWPGAVVLARIAATMPMVGPRVRVLELGCGLALPSLAAAARGAVVISTDWQRQPLQFARASAARNRLPFRGAQMDWCAPALRSGFDVCLAAEIGYDQVAGVAAARTLADVLRPGGTVWLADSVNLHRSEVVATLVQRGFAVEVTEVTELEDGRAVRVRVVQACAPVQ